MKEPALRVGAFAVDHINLAISALVGADPRLQLDPVDQSLLVAPLQVSVAVCPVPEAKMLAKPTSRSKGVLDVIFDFLITI
jgi:hypothetical protein